MIDIHFAFFLKTLLLTVTVYLICDFCILKVLTTVNLCPFINKVDVIRDGLEVISRSRSQSGHSQAIILFVSYHC